MKKVNDILQYKVLDAMSKNLITLNPKEPIGRAIEIFDKYDIHHIPIVILDRLVGIISQGDVLYLQGTEQNRDGIKTFNLGRADVSLHSSVDEIMTSNPIVVDSTITITDAINILIKHRINALPVIENGKLSGIITTHDILRFITK